MFSNIDLLLQESISDTPFKKVNLNSLSESSNNIDPSKLYFVSFDNMDGKVLSPRIPDNYFTKNGYEENKTPRVCFAPSIKECLTALSMALNNKELYVFNISKEYIDKLKSNKSLIYKPTTKEVPDCKWTNEIWVKCPVKITKIGKIKVTDDLKSKPLKFTYGNNQTAEVYRYNYEFIDE